MLGKQFVIASAAFSSAASCDAAGGKFGLRSTPITAALGTRIVRNCLVGFGSKSLVTKLYPVALPPGRPRLATSPASTGSLPVPKTIGIVEVACRAATAETSPPTATRTATSRFTRSVANAGNRSYRPSAQQYLDSNVFALGRNRLRQDLRGMPPSDAEVLWRPATDYADDWHNRLCARR